MLAPRRFPAAVRRAALRVAAAVATAGLAVLLPRAAGTSWAALTGTWQQLPPWHLLLLAALWFAGLVAHTWVQTGVLPGLRRRQALTLNLTGSAVANVVPLGGSAGVGLNLLMLRRWGFTTQESSVFCLVTTACNALVKAALPVVALFLLLVAAPSADPGLVRAAVPGAVAVAVALGAAAGVLGTPAGTRYAARLACVLRPRVRRTDVERRITELRGAVTSALRRGGRAVALGSTAYCLLGAALLWACLHAVGAHAGLVPVVALFAVERGLTAVPFTPGGVGIAEVVVTALAVRLVSSPAGGHATATAGVLLYRAFTFGAEIPVGGLWLLAWLVAARRRPAVVAAAGPADAAPVPDAA